MACSFTLFEWVPCFYSFGVLMEVRCCYRPSYKCRSIILYWATRKQANNKTLSGVRKLSKTERRVRCWDTEVKNEVKERTNEVEKINEHKTTILSILFMRRMPVTLIKIPFRTVPPEIFAAGRSNKKVHTLYPQTGLLPRRLKGLFGRHH